MTDASATCAAPPIEPEFAACFRAPSVSRIVLVALFAAIGALGAMDFGFPPVPSTILNINALSVALANIALALLIAFDREGRWAGEGDVLEEQRHVVCVVRHVERSKCRDFLEQRRDLDIRKRRQGDVLRADLIEQFVD